MADLYVAASGSNTAPYDTWAKAATSLVTAVNAMAAGDRLYVENLFQDAATVGQTFTFPGGSTDPSYVYSVTNPGMVHSCDCLHLSVSRIWRHHHTWKSSHQRAVL